MKAVLQAKLANLEKVAPRQEQLLAEINELAEQKYQVGLLDYFNFHCFMWYTI